LTAISIGSKVRPTTQHTKRSFTASQQNGSDDLAETDQKGGLSPGVQRKAPMKSLSSEWRGWD
jgi:hypothetical protein